MAKSGTRSGFDWSSYRFPLILLGAILLGSILGLVMGERATVFKPLGDIFLNLMFTIVVPLVFTTIASAIAGMADMKRLGKIIGYMFLVFVVTGLIASVIMITLTAVFPPGKGVSFDLPAAEGLEPFSTGDQIVSAITVSDFPDLISRSHMLPLIIFSIFFGFAVISIGEKGKIIAKGLDALAEVFMKLITLLMYYAPIGLGAYFAALVGELGPELLGSYARAMVVYYPICIVYFFVAFIAYTYFAGGKTGVKSYFKNVFSPAITSIATQSSIASLPVNLEAASKMGVPRDVREIVLPVGATMHMDGTCLSSILKITFLFGIFNVPFEGIGMYISAILISVLGGVVMSGVPGGGLIGEMLIVSMYGFPPEAFPIVATIGYLVDPPATMLNVTGDSAAAMMVTRLIEGKDRARALFQKDGSAGEAVQGAAAETA